MKLKKSSVVKIHFSISILIIFAGILITALRLLLPLVADYRQQIATSLTNVLGMKITIGGLKAQLIGFTPQLRLTDLTLQPPHTSPLRLQELQLQLDPIASLRHQQIRLAGLAISGVELVMHLDSNSNPFWEFNLNSNATTLPLNLFLAHGPLSLLNGTVRLERPNSSPLIIQPVKILLVPNGNNLQVEVTAGLGKQGNLKLLAELDLVTKTRGRIYLKAEDLLLGTAMNSWLSLIIKPPFKFNTILNTELWGQWNNSQIDVAGPITLHDLELGANNQVSTQPLSLSTDLSGQWKIGRSWNAHFSNLSWEYAGQDYGAIELAMQGTDLTSVQNIRVAIAELAIEDLIKTASILPLPNTILATANKLHPQGQIQDLLLELTLLPNRSPNWEVNAQVNELHFKPIATAPGINGLDLNLHANSSGGWAELNADEMILTAPSLFRGPLTNLHLTGTVQWKKATNNTFVLESKALTLENQDLYTHLRLSAQLPLTGGPPFLDLQGTINGDVAAMHNYFPVGIMKQPLINWLDRALIAGNLTAGQFILRGLGKDFPFRANQGQFDAVLNAEDLTLEYKEDWPHLEQASGELHFFGPGMAINLHHAHLLNSQIDDAKSYVADIKPAPHLPISGHASGPFADVLRILRGPLAATHGRYTTGIEVQGNSTIDLTIAVPIEHWAKLQLDGQIHWRDAALQMQEWGINLNNIAGNLHFTDQGLFAQGISTHLGEEKLTLNVDTPQSSTGKSQATNLDINFLLNNELLTALAPNGPWEKLSGSAPGHLQLSFPHPEDKVKSLNQIKFLLESNLDGLGLNFPAPLGKAVDTARPMYLRGFLPLNTPQQLDWGYGELKAALNMESVLPFELTAGEITSNIDSVPKPERFGLNFSGKIARLDLPSWMDLLKTTKPGILALPPVQANVRIGDLGLANVPIKDFMLQLKQTVVGWEAQIAAANVAGKIKVPTNSRLHPIQAHFNLVRIDLPENQLDASPYSSTPQLFSTNTAIESTPPDPQQAPALEVQIDNLQLGKQSLGAVTANLIAVPNGLNLKQFNLKGPLFNINGQGTWTGSPEMQTTQLYLEGNSANFGETLRNLGFTSALEKANLQVQANLNWLASPQEVALENINGNIKLSMGAGQVADVNPGVGRLFGLLSLETIQRRLSLDFTDLFGKGFAFDSLNGKFTLHNGDAFAQEIKIIGPAATMSISGRTGLVARDYDQFILVTPLISTTLPVAGAFAVGPIAAAALFVAGRVVGDQFNHLARLQYRLTGPWEQAELMRIETQDGWSVSNLLVPNATSKK